MSEELENKINDELLGMKKHIKEITEEKQKATTSLVNEQYKEEARFNFFLFLVPASIGLLMVIFGIIVYVQIHDVVNIDCSTIIVAGLLLILYSIMLWVIRRNRLTFSHELKQLELRMTEMLKK